MRGKFFFGGLIWLLVMIGLLVGVGYLAYNAGLTQGLATSVDPEALGPYVRGPIHKPYGFGFGFIWLLCLIPFFFLAFGFVFKGMMWSRRGYYGGWGRHGYGSRKHQEGEIPPWVQDWHRRMHGEGKPEETDAESGDGETV